MIKIIQNERSMKAFGAELIQQCEGAGVITLKGNLGTGKTTIVRGALESRGINSGIRSPTYTLIEYYELGGLCVAHFDLYRLGDAEELEYLGYRDYLQSDTLCFIEWPERAEGYLNNIGLQINIEYIEDGRKIELVPGNVWGQNLIQRLRLPKF